MKPTGFGFPPAMLSMMPLSPASSITIASVSLVRYPFSMASAVHFTGKTRHNGL